MKYSFIILIYISILACSDDSEPNQTPPVENFSFTEFRSTINAPFGPLAYSIYYPLELVNETQVIILSRGGNGQGDDRGQLLSYAQHFVAHGYVIVQIDHRNAGSNIENIAILRGEEINFISKSIDDGTLNYGNFAGTIDGSKQGYIGHSAGAMEGLLAAGMDMTHGNYLSPAIKAVYAMSPPGYSPDQFGIKQNPNGYTSIGQAAVFMIIGEDEKDSNGMETIIEEDWRLQGFEQMNESGLRIQVLVNGQNTRHEDIAGLNGEVKAYNEQNALALFDTYLKSIDRTSEIGTLAMPANNPLVISKKGL